MKTGISHSSQFPTNSIMDPGHSEVSQSTKQDAQGRAQQQSSLQEEHGSALSDELILRAKGSRDE